MHWVSNSLVVPWWEDRAGSWLVVFSIITPHPHLLVLVAASAWLTRQRAGVHRAVGVPHRPKAPQRYRRHTWASRSPVPALVRLPPSPAGLSIRGAVGVPACSGLLTSQDVLQAAASWTWMLREKGYPGRSSSWRGSWTPAARASAWTSRSPVSTRIRMQVSVHASQSERPCLPLDHGQPQCVTPLGLQPSGQRHHAPASAPAPWCHRLSWEGGPALLLRGQKAPGLSLSAAPRLEQPAIAETPWISSWCLGGCLLSEAPAARAPLLLAPCASRPQVSLPSALA